MSKSNLNILNRRAFLSQSFKVSMGIALSTLVDIPFVMKRALAEGNIGLNGKKILFIWLRGANDSLNSVIPIGDPQYAVNRPTIALPQDPGFIYSGVNAYTGPCFDPTLYSAGGVESQLRKGVRQLKPFDGEGMVALNIDDLVQPSVHWRSSTADILGAAMERANENFLHSHMGAFDEYFREAKLSAVAVSVTLFGEINSGGPRFNYMHQLTVMVSRYARASVRTRFEILASSVGAEIEA